MSLTRSTLVQSTVIILMLVMAPLRAAAQPEPMVLVGAHYDVARQTAFFLRHGMFDRRDPAP